MSSSYIERPSKQGAFTMLATEMHSYPRHVVNLDPNHYDNASGIVQGNTSLVPATTRLSG